MFNISKQGSSLLITSNDNSQFPWKDGQMSLPMNSVVYVIDESDYIAFRSASNNDILFTALIDEIQINGTNVTKDDFILQFDNVANSAGGGGGSASAGVNSINGFQGDLTLKSINGQSLIGSGDIEISGGEGGTAGVNKIIMGDEDYGWNAYQGDVKLTNGWVDLDDDGKSETYDIRVGNNSGSSLWFGFNSTDNSIKIEDNGSRLSFTVNPDILGGGGSVTETDPIFESWKNRNYVTLGNGATDSDEGNGIVIGYNASGSSNTISIGQFANAAINSIAIGKQATTTKASDIAIGNELGGVKTDSTYKINIGNTFKGDTSNYAYVLNEYGNYVRIPTEWTGTQSQYDALGTYYDNITYNIIEG